MSHDQSNVSPYRKVSTSTWSDRKVLNLSPLKPSGQALFLMLMVGPQTTNIPGIQPVGRMAFAEMLGWELEAFDEAFAEAFREGLAKADWKARFIFVPNAIRHNPPQSVNVVKSWANMWSRVPECDLKIEAWHALYDALLELGEAYANAFKCACPLDFSPTEAMEPEPLPKASGKPSGKTTDIQEAVSSKQELREAKASSSASPPTEPPTPLEPAEPQGAPAKPGLPPCPYDRLLDAYGEALPMLAQPRRSLLREGKNAAAMRQRWAWVLSAKHESGDLVGQRLATTADEAVDWFGRYFTYVGQSDFLTGVNGRFTGCDIGWLMTADNFAKVLSGKYHANLEAAYA